VEFLGDFHGILISDGFSGYNKLLNVIRAGCWAHMQRKWREAMPKGEIGKKSVAAQGYKFCNRLFRLERDMEGLSDAERQAKRQEKAKPIIDEYYAWIDRYNHAPHRQAEGSRDLRPKPEGVSLCFSRPR